MLSPGITRFAAGLCFVLTLSATPSWAKPRHYEQVRVLLISRMASCTACHATSDGKKLNAYGDRIAAQPKDLPMADRIARLESEKGSSSSKDRDVDQDGVPNWVEILAQKSPADAKEKPDQKTAEKITSVVSCRICHRETGLPGEGLTANPHNDLGELLAKTVRPSKGQPKPKSDHDLREAAERFPILSRFAAIRTKKAKGSAATYWQTLRMLRSPAEANDKPSTDEVKTLKKEIAARKREKKKTPKFGLDCSSHPLDGFLLDAGGLE